MSYILLAALLLLTSATAAMAMPPIGALIGAIVGIAAGIASVVIPIAISIGLSVISGLLAPKQKKAQAQGPVEKGITQLIRASAEPHRIIWGERLVSGVLSFAEVSGSDNEFLHMTVAIAGHQSQEITTVFLDDVGIDDSDMDGSGNVTAGRFSGKVRIKKHLGLDDQVADSDLVSAVSDWTSAHRQRGVTYVYLRLSFDRDIFPTGIPNVKAMTKGRLIADPRDTAITITSSSVANPTVITTASAHGLSAGDRVFISGHSGSTPEVIGEYQVLSAPSSTTITVDENVTVGGTGGSLLQMKWSDNAALCLRDYILADFGLNSDQADEIDDVRSDTAADICDEEVNLPTALNTFNFTAVAATDLLTQTVAAGVKPEPLHPIDGVELTTSGTLPGGLALATTYFVISVSGKEEPSTFKLATSIINARAGTAINITSTGSGTHTLTRKTQLRYTVNGVASLEDDPINIAPPLISAMGGQLVYTQGKYTMLAGAYNGPATIPTLTEDSLRDELTIRPRPGKADIHNSVRGVFIDRDNKFLKTDFPPIVNSTFVTADKEEKIFKDIELFHVTDTHRAQRLAVLVNQRGRQGMMLDYPANLTVLEVAVGDVVDVTNDLLDITDKEFEVLAWTLAEDGGIDLVLKETAAGIYSFNPETDQQVLDIAPNTNLPGAFDAPPIPTGLALASGTAHLLLESDGTVVSRVKATWDAVPSVLVTSGGRIEIQMKKNADSVWDTMPSVSGDETQAFLSPVEDGTAYDVRIRSVNKLGVTSDGYNTVSGHTVAGKSAVPPDVFTFVVATLADGTRKFEWTMASLPADVRAGGGYQIRYASGASLTWATGTKLHEGLLISSPFETNELAAGQFTFGIKAFDSSNNESANDIQITATLGDPRLRNVFIQRVEHSLLWPGTLTDCFIAPENVLEAVFSGSPAADWDSLPSTWNALADTWRGIVANATPLRYETPVPVMDLGADTTFTPLVTVEGVGTVTVEMRTHTEAEGSDLSAEAWVALAQVVSERYIQIRVSIAGTTPVAITMTTLLDGEVIVEDFEDINTATEAGAFFNLIAAGHFEVGTNGDMSAISQAQITAIQSVTVPHTWTLVSKTKTVGGNPAAEFKIFDDNGTLVNATIDLTIKGPKA